MADINFNTVSVASAVNNSDYLHITTGNSHKRVLVSTLISKAQSGLLSESDSDLLDRLTDGCFIMYHLKTNNTPRAVAASKWEALQNAGEGADGVLVVSGGRHIVVAPTQAPSKMHWSSEKGGANPSAYNTDREACFSDFDGKNKTAAILADATIGGDGDGYAPGYCAAYSRTNANGQGLTAGKWWLPSIGELLLILQNKQKINMCLSLISGATLLKEDVYWSSSEYSQSLSWYMYLSNSLMDTYGKTASNAYVLPVSAFIL